MNKNFEAYKTIGEVAKILDINSKEKNQLLLIQFVFGRKNLNKLNLRF